MQPPPQAHATGGRRALDERWLDHLKAHPPEPTPPPPDLAAGIALFDAGRFHEAHETWERAWRDGPYPERLFYLGLTKLSAGLEQARRGNATSGRRLLREAFRALEPFQPAWAGVATSQLARDAAAWPNDSSPPPRIPLS